MCDLKICRICLNYGVKIYDHNQYHLKQFYEDVMGKKINESDYLPLQFCYECASVLQKFHKFKEKCYIAENVLQKMTQRGPITLSSISVIHRQNTNLQSTLGIIVITKRIRTCIVKHKSALKTQIKQNDQKEIEESDCATSNFLNDKNLPEIQNENIDIVKHDVVNKGIDTIETRKVTIGNENISIDEKATPGVADDKVFSNDEEFDTKFANDAIQENNINEKFNRNTIEEKKITGGTEQNNDNIGKDSHKKTNKKKDKSFLNRDTTNNHLDPNHWLKINLSEEEAFDEFNAKAHDLQYLTAAYHCNNCYKGFSKEDMLNRHIKLRHCEFLGSLECRFCKMRFKLKCYLTRHITQHYTKYKCLRCDTICPLLTTALFHNAYHNGVKRQCKYCGEEFRHPSTYYTHLRTHRSEHVCTLCGASFVSTAGLNLHKKAMHVDTVVNPEEVDKMYCERCDIKFETQEAYAKHMIHSVKHAEGVEDLAGETGPSMPKRRRTLFKQYRSSTPCPICNVTFPSNKAFIKHRLAKHTGEQIPKERKICEICGALLKWNSMSTHLKTHTQRKMFTCPLPSCDMQFTTKSSMQRHQVTHTDEKPFQCTLCERRFTQKNSMDLHYRTFHLKEPYPKRNRKKKTVIPPHFEDFIISREKSV